MGDHMSQAEQRHGAQHDELLARLEWFELSGRVERLSSIVNGSIKHLPPRYRLV